MEKQRRLSIIALISFLVSLTLCAFLISAAITNRTHIETLEMEQHIFEKNFLIIEEFEKLFNKTQLLSAIVIQGNGNIDSFDIIAPSIVDNPVIQNVLLAPDGIAAKVYPAAGNESIIGLDLFSADSGGKEAMAARDLGELVLGGPFGMVQDRQEVAGILPVYIDTQTEKHTFWGLASITLKFPEILEKAEFEIFESQGYEYELWRFKADTNERQVLASSEKINTKSRFIEKPVHILNAEWFLRLSPVHAWHSYPGNIALVIAGFCISFFVFFVMQNNSRLKKMRSAFELMAITDPLTGIFNRRHFFNVAQISIEKSRRQKTNAFIVIFDIDRFKKVNDTYGHTIGDKVLLDITARIKTGIRPYDLLARYGGEEFIIYTSDISNDEMYEMAERLRLNLCNNKFEYEEVSFNLSASFGIAHISDFNIENTIKYADEALYTAKREGRNKVVFFRAGKREAARQKQGSDI